MDQRSNAVRQAGSRRQRFLRSPLPVLLGCPGLGVLTYANLRLLAHFPDLTAWLPAGAGLGLLLLFGPRMAPAIVIGTAGGLAAAGVPPLGACLAALVAGVSGLLGWLLLARVRPLAWVRVAVSPLARLLLTGSAVGALAAWLSGPIAIAALAPLAAHPAGPAPAMTQLLFGDALGVMLLAPALVWIAHPPQTGASRAHWSGAATFVLLAALTLAIFSGALAQHIDLPGAALLVLAPALWLALRHGAGYTVAANALLVLCAGIGTSLGLGPYAADSAALPLTLAAILSSTLLAAASRAECRHAEATIVRLATHDALTGVANRPAFSKRMEQVLDTAAREAGPVALLFIDLNHFKQVNDTLGQQMGDLLLAETARRILGCIRSDALPGRFGDDEFVVMLDHAGNRDILGGIARRIADAVSTPFELGTHRCEIGCAIGISLFPQDGASVPELVRKAEAAMQQVKAGGGSGYRFYTAPRAREKSAETAA